MGTENIFENDMKNIFYIQKCIRKCTFLSHNSIIKKVIGLGVPEILTRKRNIYMFLFSIYLCMSV